MSKNFALYTFRKNRFPMVFVDPRNLLAESASTFCTLRKIKEAILRKKAV